MNLKMSVVFLSLLSTPALADTVTITFSGTVAPYVWTGSSYVTGNPLSGDSFTTTWTVVACSGCSSGQVASAVLTIEGQVFPYAQGVNMNAYVTPTQIYLNDTVYPGAVALNSYVTTHNAPFPTALTTPFSYQTVADDNFASPFHLGGSFWTEGPDGYLQVASVAVDNPSYIGSPFLVPAPILGTGLPALLVLLFGWLGMKFVHLWAWWAVKRKPLTIRCVNGGRRETCPYRKECWCSS